MILNQKIKLGFWTILSVTIGISGASFIFQNAVAENTSNTVLSTKVEEIENTEEKKPEYSYIALDPKKKPKVTAGAYLVGDLETGEIIIEKNEDKKFPIASVSKLMTALVSKELKNRENLIQISKQALSTEGVNGDLHLNERIKIGDLLYPLLLESSNDAAEAIAISSERSIFIKKMNERAKDLGLINTTFEDPSGLSPRNQSTTNDLFKLAKYIKDENADLFEITTKRSFTNEAHVWFSNNQFIKEDGYLGGKSGYTDEALQTGVSLFSVSLSPVLENRHIAITLLRSNDRKKDVASILKYLKQNIYYGAEPEKKDGVAQKEQKPETEEPDFVNLAFAGDVMLDRGVKNSVMKNFNGDYSKLFEKKEVSDLLKKADIVFANLEGTASDKGKDGKNLYSFRMDPSVIPALKGAGIDILSLANNHVGDWGPEAYIDTLARLRENEILYTGGGNNTTEAEEPVIVEKYGIKIGFLGFSDKGPDWMRATDEAGLLIASNPRFDEIIKNAKTKVDYLVISFHFGEEYQTKHNERQEYLARRAVDNGAKIVIGHHPHVIEDTEVYKDSYIAYSLGNFIFDQGFSENTMQGLLLEIKLSKDGSISATKNIVKSNKVFQPDTVIKGKEEKVKFQEPKIIQTL